MNRIVYSTDPAVMAQQVEPIHREETMREWEEAPRVSRGKHELAKATLRTEYQRKAMNVGMSLDAYCQRFNVKL